jgi:hypothetical protein
LAGQEKALGAVIPTAESMGWTGEHPTMTAARDVVTGLLKAIQDARAEADPTIYRQEFLAVREAGKAAVLALSRGAREMEGAALATAARVALDAGLAAQSAAPAKKARVFAGVASQGEEQAELSL